MRGKKSFMTAVLMALAIVLIQAQEVKVPLRFDFYYSYEKVTEALKALNAAYPELTKLDQVGKSEEGRIIWALQSITRRQENPWQSPAFTLTETYTVTRYRPVRYAFTWPTGCLPTTEN